VKTFAYVCADPGIPIPGNKGASIHVASVCRSFVRRGLSGTLYAVRPEASTLEGIPIAPIRLPGFPVRESAAERETRLFLAGFRPQLAADDACDFVYERYSLWHVGGLVSARELGVPFILEVNSPLPDEAKRFRGLAQEALASGLARLLLREADGVVCVSDQVAKWVGAHRDSDKGVWVVPNGVDPELFSPQGAKAPYPWPAAEDDPLIAFSGSFRPWHGLDDLLEAFRRVVERTCPRARLLCVGDGPLRGGFERKLQAAGLTGRVHLTGMLPQEQVAQWIRWAHVAVVPYPPLDRFYFSPLKLFEFMALGLPVVAADVGQVAAVLAHGDRGLLYPPGKPAELARAIGRLLESPDEACRLGRAGHEWVLAQATWSKRVDCILDHIAKLDRRSSIASRVRQ
jgi:glycosyltransferase involved in cell wall biosynthesis